MTGKSATNQGGDPATPTAKITIVTNNLIAAKTSVEADWINTTSVALAFISTVNELLKLPDGTRLLIKDYRTGKNPQCVCQVARLMIIRGNFQEY